MQRKFKSRGREESLQQGGKLFRISSYSIFLLRLFYDIHSKVHLIRCMNGWVKDLLTEGRPASWSHKLSFMESADVTDCFPAISHSPCISMEMSLGCHLFFCKIAPQHEHLCVYILYLVGNGCVIAILNWRVTCSSSVTCSRDAAKVINFKLSA